MTGILLAKLGTSFGTGDLYAFSSFTFTNASTTGQNGPTLAACQSAYSATSWTQNTAYFNMTTQGIQLWTVPRTRNYTIRAVGASGGGLSTLYGADCTGTFSLTKGDIIQIAVGQLGSAGTSGCGYANLGGGGGGSFVVTNAGSALIIAGGGGGGSQGSSASSYANYASTSGNQGYDTGGAGGTSGNGGGYASGQCVNSGAGGGGFLSNGSYGGTLPSTIVGKSWGNGLIGGTGYADYGGTVANGGFGGGAGSNSYMGGGGVLSCSCAAIGAGGGAGSINNGTSPSNTQYSANSMGFVTITAV